jgi:hypothetical protein
MSDSTKVFTVRERGHWYDASGTAVHTVPKKTSKTGEMRNTTVADARKMGLKPSATNILAVMEKPQLVAYKVNQAILSALTLPRIPTETLDEFALRVVEDSEQHAASAAALGTLCHAKMEAALLVANMDQIDLSDVEASSPEAAMNLRAFFDILAPSMARPCTPEELEFRVVHQHYGFAGTCDCLLAIKPDSPIGDLIRAAGYALPEGMSHYNVFADLKTRGYKTKKVPTYESDAMQLAAYSSARIKNTDDETMFGHIADLFPHLSLIVNTLKSTEVADDSIAAPFGVHVWDPTELKEAFHAFLSTFELWKFLKSYNPTKSNTNEQ